MRSQAIVVTTLLISKSSPMGDATAILHECGEIAMAARSGADGPHVAHSETGAACPLATSVRYFDISIVRTYMTWSHSSQKIGRVSASCFRRCSDRRNAEGEESFDITVCTPAWLGKRVADVGMIFGRHYLVVNDYDVEAIRLFLVEYADTCSAPTWSDVGAKLSRMLHWEFEDYVPYRGSDERT